MLAVISDIHLSDGTTGRMIRDDAFKTFRDTLRDLAYDASWREDGIYRPIDEIHLVLLGDILDVIRSTTWLGEGPKPAQVGPEGEDLPSQMKSCLKLLSFIEPQDFDPR